MKNNNIYNRIVKLIINSLEIESLFKLKYMNKIGIMVTWGKYLWGIY